MTKSPAFQFYPDDFMGGAPAEMEPDETHVYIWLLCRDWNQNGFEFDTARLARFCRMSEKRFARAWVRVSTCFEERDGRYFNPRLDRERQKQEAWREKSSVGGKAGAKSRWGEHDHPVTTPIRVVTPIDDTPVSGFQSPDYVTTTTAGRDLLLARLTPNRRTAMRAKLDQWAQGYDLPAGSGVPTPDQLDRACLDLLASVEDPASITPKALSAFLTREMRADRPAPKSSGPTSLVDALLQPKAS